MTRGRTAVVVRILRAGTLEVLAEKRYLGEESASRAVRRVVETAAEEGCDWDVTATPEGARSGRMWQCRKQEK